MKIGTTELIVVLIAVILIFGPKQLPRLARLAGEAVRGMRKGISEPADEEEGDTES